MQYNLQISLDLIGYLFLSSLIFICSCSEVEESVPVCIWDGQKPPIEVPAVSAFPIPVSHLEGKYLKNFDSSNILLFLLDTLSVEDFSSHECVFKHVSKWMENSHSLYLPAVETKHSLQHALSSEGYNVITLQSGSSIGELKLKKNTKNLVVVKLPSTATNPSRQKALQKADEVIGNVLSKIGKTADFTVIFSGMKPSISLDNEIVHTRVSRAARPTLPENSDPKFHYTPCVILYLKNDITLYKGNSSFALESNNTIDVFDCQDETASIIMLFKEVGEYQKLSVTLHFVRHTRRWTMVNANLKIMVNGHQENATLTPLWQMEDVPLNKSYACTRTITFISDETDGQKRPVYKLKIDGIQVQAFSNKQTRFSDGWDCVGFFTIPIWTGIIAGVIMLLILLVGLFMLSDVKTMDRFDDPKGAHIAVTGSNE